MTFKEMKIECNVGGDTMLLDFIELPVVVVVVCVYVSNFICFVESVFRFCAKLRRISN